MGRAVGRADGESPRAADQEEFWSAALGGDAGVRTGSVVAVAAGDLVVLLGGGLGDLAALTEVTAETFARVRVRMPALRATPFSSVSAGSSNGCCCSCAVSLCSSPCGSCACTSMNSPCGRRLMTPVSRPCSTFSLSRRWRPRHQRLVMMKVSTGITKKPTRTKYVTSFSDRCRWVANRSLPPATSSTRYRLIQAAPSAVRTGALRGRSRMWCSRLSPVTQPSMNG